MLDFRIPKRWLLDTINELVFNVKTLAGLSAQTSFTLFGQTAYVRKSGRMCDLRFAAVVASAYTPGDQVVGTIPAGYRPQGQMYGYILSDTNLGVIFLMEFNTTGTIVLKDAPRIGGTNASANIAANHWLAMHISYVTVTAPF